MKMEYCISSSVRSQWLPSVNFTHLFINMGLVCEHAGRVKQQFVRSLFAKETICVRVRGARKVYVATN